MTSYWQSIDLVIHPTEAPWRNPLVEALVKQLKFSLKVMPNVKLCLLEFKTLMNLVTCAIKNPSLGIQKNFDNPLDLIIL